MASVYCIILDESFPFLNLESYFSYISKEYVLVNNFAFSYSHL